MNAKRILLLSFVVILIFTSCSQFTQPKPTATDKNPHHPTAQFADSNALTRFSFVHLQTSSLFFRSATSPFFLKRVPWRVPTSQPIHTVGAFAFLCLTAGAFGSWFTGLSAIETR